MHYDRIPSGVHSAMVGACGVAPLLLVLQAFHLYRFVAMGHLAPTDDHGTEGV